MVSNGNQYLRARENGILYFGTCLSLQTPNRIKINLDSSLIHSVCFDGFIRFQKRPSKSNKSRTEPTVVIKIIIYGTKKITQSDTKTPTRYHGR
jgi:hypothetical protein